MTKRVKAKHKSISSRTEQSENATRRRMLRTAEEFFAKPQRFREAHSKTIDVLSRMRKQHVSLTKAAKELRVDPRTVIKYGGTAFKKSSNGRYAAKRTDKLLRILVTPSPEGLREVAVRGTKPASVLAKHANAMRLQVRTGRDTELKQFEDKYIIDASGERIPLLTDLSVIDQLANAGVLSFENIYARST